MISFTLTIGALALYGFMLYSVEQSDRDEDEDSSITEQSI